MRNDKIESTSWINQYHTKVGFALLPFILTPMGQAIAALAPPTSCTSGKHVCPPVDDGYQTCKGIWVSADCACDTGPCTVDNPAPPPGSPASPTSPPGPSIYGNGISGNADSTYFSNNQVYNPLTASSPQTYDCNSNNVSWSYQGYTCSGGISGCSNDSTSGSDTACPIPAGTSVSVKDTTGRGSITYSCNGNNGSLQADQSSATCGPDQYCDSTTLTWTVGNYSCSGVAPRAIGNSSTDVSTTSGNSGTNRYTCQVDAYHQTAPQYTQTVGFNNATCVPRQVTVYVNCPSTTESWTGGCNGTSQANGSQQVYVPASGSTTYHLDPSIFGNNTAGRNGSAYFDCTYQVTSSQQNGDHITGTFTTTPDVSPASSCNLNPTCASGSVSWAVNSASCASTIAGGNIGDNSVVSASANVSNSAGAGTNTYQCQQSGNLANWVAVGPASCAIPPPPNCTATTVSWTVNSLNCQAPISNGASGSSSTVSASVGNYSSNGTGSDTFQCLSSGNTSTWTSVGPASCAIPPPPPVTCSSGTLSWNVSGNNCSATIGNGTQGSNVNLNASAGTAGSTGTGSDIFQCQNVSNVGQWVSVGPASCTTPAPPSPPPTSPPTSPPAASCVATSLTWTDELSCTKSTTAGASGTSQTLTINNTAKLGSATYTCSNGTWVLNDGYSCTAKENCGPGTGHVCQ